MNEQRENRQDLINRAMKESGGKVYEPIQKDPITGMFHRVPTEEELKQLRGSEGLMQIINPTWEHSLDAHHAKCDRRRFA